MSDTNSPSRASKVASVFWAILIGIGIIALAGAVLLPSTKRARVDVEELRRMREASAAAQAAEESVAPVAPTTAAAQP